MEFKKLNEELIKEWDWEKNKGINPRRLEVPEKTYLWWVCNEEGHSWSARLDHRKRGSGCPYCSGRLLDPNNSLASKHPNVAMEWHPIKNKVGPGEVSKATTKVFWWLCKKGHEWQASVANRTRRRDKCPYCSGKMATEETCLFTLEPELAKEWNYNKNSSLTPHDVTLMSNKKVWWICKEGHEWEDKIFSRVRGNRCSVCYPRKPWQPVSNSYNLKVFNPHLLIEWHPTKNNGIDPEHLSPRSTKKVYWLCTDCGHEWQASIDNRNGGNRGCPECQKGRSSSIQEQCIFYYLNKIYPDIISRHILTNDKGKKFEVDIFIPSLNLAIEYDGYFYHKSRVKQDELKNEVIKNLEIKLIRIRENNGPEKKLPLIERHGSNEIQCDARKVESITAALKHIIESIIETESESLLKTIDIDIKRDYLMILENAKKNERSRSLAALHPDLAEEWHKEKNHTLTAWNFTPGSKKRVWWTCSKCTKDWSAIINKRVNGQACPYCAGNKAGHVRSLKSERPQTAAMWHPTKNGDVTPEDVLPGSTHLAWWHCSKCDQDWKEPIGRRSSKKGCPYCNGKRVFHGNCLATLKPDIAVLWHPTKNGKLSPNDVTSSSGKIVWWKCKCGHEFEKKISNIREKCSICKKK